jgi:ATP-dependent Clp protease ATP-binding subunit ClpA
LTPTSGPHFYSAASAKTGKSPRRPVPKSNASFARLPSGIFKPAGRIVFYKPLTKTEIGGIVDLLLQNLENRLKDKQLRLTVTERAKRFVVDTVLTLMYGARPLKRFLQSQVETLMAA